MACRLLHEANVVPGMHDAASQFDPIKLKAWIEEVRQTLAERKRKQRVTLLLDGY